jgi:hypothetical protein
VPLSNSSEDVLGLALVNLPLNGITLMLLLMAPYLLGFRPEPQEVKAHVLVVLVSVTILTLLGAVIDLVAYDGGTPSTLSFAVGGLAILVLYTTVTFRYLGRSLDVSVYTGLVFAILNVLSWTMLIGWDRPDMDRALDLLRDLFPALLLLFFVLLAVETFVLHVRPRSAQDPAPSRETAPEGAGSMSRTWEVIGLLPVAALIAIAANTVV